MPQTAAAQQLQCKACGASWLRRSAGFPPSLCPTCKAAGLQWCSKCELAKHVSEFYPGQSRACVSCCARPPAEYVCGGCGTGFRRTQRGGAGQEQRVHLCDECESEYKWCPACDSVKLLDRFNIARDKRDGRIAHCRECQRARNRTPAARKRQVLRQHGLTAAEWEAMYLAQSGLCASCGKPPPPDARSRGLAVDHDHQTGRVRSLLCIPCNVGLGHFNDDPKLLRLAADYLEREALAGGD